MNKRLLLIGCLSVLLGTSSASSAGEFTLYDPGVSLNIKMTCDAKHYAKGSWKDLHPFKLHLEIFFEERYALLTEGNATNDVRMDLTGVVPTDKNPQEYLVLSRGTATAIINMEHHDVILSDFASTEGEDYSMSGRDCRSDQQGQDMRLPTPGA